ncbi:Hypothetical protein I595_2377 [Croceitalea dokdonensis DOKDO 023]|uniref:Uncharacterized protein n=1 Tax=Croceitalea dokdonensis DOKDO 023 TaxID=1300341 RepID=A0A0P7AF38_9FLAO|nr:Hypothetical protein I595_2377 [Croceitalea dokdonensis DOKDO 023]
MPFVAGPMRNPERFDAEMLMEVPFDPKAKFPLSSLSEPTTLPLTRLCVIVVVKTE